MQRTQWVPWVAVLNDTPGPHLLNCSASEDSDVVVQLWEYSGAPTIARRILHSLIRKHCYPHLQSQRSVPPPPLDQALHAVILACSAHGRLPVDALTRDVGHGDP